MSDRLRFDTSEVNDLIVTLNSAGPIARDEARKVVAKGALNIKTGAQRRVTGLAHAPNYPRSITYDTQDRPSGPSADIGPDKQKTVGGGPYRTPGNLGAILEFGTSKNSPHPHMLPAAEEELPRFVTAMEALAVKAIER
jgi:hypothetical protein